MAKWTIYHNPKCSKSREVLGLLKERGIEPHVREYLKEPLSPDELSELMDKLKEPSTLVRQKEDAYKQFKFDVKSREEVVRHLSRHPVLMERPVVVKDQRAVVVRPTELIDELF